MIQIITCLALGLIILAIVALFLGMTLGAVMSLIYIGLLVLSLLIAIGLVTGTFSDKGPPS